MKGIRSSRMGLAAVAAALALGCGAKPASVSLERPLPRQEPRVFLVAARQKDRVERSLRDAGLALGSDPLDAPYLLRVTIGTTKGTRACGILANVKYALRHEGEAVLEISARGWTGSCEPNVLDEMSRRLMEQFEIGGVTS